MTDEQVARLREVFRLVQDADHWKNPVDAAILQTDATTDEIREAVIFFAGSVPKISPCHIPVRHRDGLVEFLAPGHHVVADGYFATIGS